MLNKSIGPVLACVLVLLPVAGASGQDESKKAPAATDEHVKWQDTEAGQFVFFAVLEGLYRDGVPQDVVELVVNPVRDMDNKVKHAFVFQCDICHAAYEAFVLYSRRQTFQKSAGRDTFGKGVDAAIVNGLKSDAASTRVIALGKMMRPWIAARVELLKYSREQQDELVATLMNFKAEADKKLSALRRDDPLYKGWMFYGGCQACEAATEIARISSKK